MFRRQKVEITDIFLGFERFGKALGLFLFQALFIFLWALLLFVPGIIAAIRYSQAFFILADDPTKGIRQCMDESKAMMRGNKAKFFCLNLSFIGWAILGALPASILDGIMGGLYVTGFGATIVSIIGGLFMAPVTAYIYSASAGFYEILSGHLIKETEPAPVEAEEPTPIPSAESARKEEPRRRLRSRRLKKASPQSLKPQKLTRLSLRPKRTRIAVQKRKPAKTMTGKDNYKFFSHRECEYFPCHNTKNEDEFNCLFCYCPLYTLGEGCGGNYRYTEEGIKDCSNCLVPHGKDAYEKIMAKWQAVARLASENRRHE